MTLPPSYQSLQAPDWKGHGVKPTRILLVEDSPGDALLVRQIAAESPYPITLSVARDGEQALTILGDLDLDAALIILDLDLPEVSHDAVLERNPARTSPWSSSARQRTQPTCSEHWTWVPANMP